MYILMILTVIAKISVLGLAWTVMGGEIMFVEATKMSGTGELLLTGQLGICMVLCYIASLHLV